MLNAIGGSQHREKLWQFPWPTVVQQDRRWWIYSVEAPVEHFERAHQNEPHRRFKGMKRVERLEKAAEGVNELELFGESKAVEFEQPCPAAFNEGHAPGLWIMDFNVG
jgi:hypothetical protein